ncbi:MAG: SDR family NAD(P)-dependent oxidoreductase [Bacteroidetes bacterium]|nr:SDR family NAD(P)-dependent oxidoreductase [Bacteroidota bacterium]
MKEGKWAMIAGSADGLGEAFTESLAAQGFNLILIDRQEEALNEIVLKVERKYGIKTVKLQLDLADEDAWKICMGPMQETGCSMLVYCAAMSEVKPFLEHNAANLERFIDVNNRTAMLLVHAFAGYLRDTKKTGKILLMSSLAGLLAPVFITPYAASKAFLISLARSLYYEFKPLNIGISVCCSGIIKTPKFLESHPQGLVSMADPNKVAGYAIRMCGKKAVCIHGWTNRLNYFVVSKFLPASLASYFVNRAMQKMYPILSR